MFSTNCYLRSLIAGLIFMVSAASAQDLSKVNTSQVVMHPKVSFDGTKMVAIANYLGALSPYIYEFEADSNRWGEPQALFSSEVRSNYEFRSMT